MKQRLCLISIFLLVLSCSTISPVAGIPPSIPKTENAAGSSITKTAEPEAVYTNTLTKTYSAASLPSATPHPFLQRLDTRLTRYYGVDRVVPKDFSTLSSFHINTVITGFDVNEDLATWQAYFSMAEKYNIGIVVIPTDWEDPRPACSWGAAYKANPVDGDMISKIKPLLDYLGTQTQFIGIVNAHEPFWTSCQMTVDEMATIKNQVKDYMLRKFNRDIQVWNYIGSIDLYISERYMKINDIPKIMDVAITWKHCIADAEGPCMGDADANSAIYQIQHDRKIIDQANSSAGSQVELIFLFQTFYYLDSASSPYTRMPTIDEMNRYGCAFLNTNALDGFFWYTWGADWYTMDLDDDESLWPAMNTVYADCVIKK
jgi:hypothetical protein